MVRVFESGYRVRGPDEAPRHRHRLGRRADVPRGFGRAGTVVHPRDQEEPVEVLQIYALRRERLGHLIAVVDAARARDDRVRIPVVVQDFAPALVEWRKVEVVSVSTRYRDRWCRRTGRL